MRLSFVGIAMFFYLQHLREIRNRNVHDLDPRPFECAQVKWKCANRKATCDFLYVGNGDVCPVSSFTRLSYLNCPVYSIRMGRVKGRGVKWAGWTGVGGVEVGEAEEARSDGLSASYINSNCSVRYWNAYFNV